MLGEEKLSSPIARDILDYLDFKRSCGIEGPSRDWTLRRLDEYFASTGAETISKDSIEGFISRHIDSVSPTAYNWICYVRDFTRWAALDGRCEYVVPPLSYKTGNARKIPYVFSESDVATFFESCRKVGFNGVWKSQAGCLFGLMCACGLRTGETAALKVSDFDPASRTLAVRFSKGNRTRVLPLTKEVADMLSLHDEFMQERIVVGRNTFFANNAGGPVTVSMAGHIFTRIWDSTGLPSIRNGARPRPYCFRHHFAHANIERWMREGKDVDAMLPYLAKYMGHTHVESTYYYVHTSPDFVQGFASFANTTDAVMPEVGFHD